MKKLMIAAAIVCAAVVSHGASVMWEGGDVYTFFGPTATATEDDFNTGYVAYWIDSASYSLENAQKDIADGKLDFLAGKSHDFSDDGYVNAVEVTGYGDGQSITGYMVIFNSDDAAKATYAFVSEEMTKSTGDKGQTAGFIFDTSDTQTGSNWVQVAPEPTSGLLLLIGVAGLALRRRRA